MAINIIMSKLNIFSRKRRDYSPMERVYRIAKLIDPELKEATKIQKNLRLEDK